MIAALVLVFLTFRSDYIVGQDTPGYIIAESDGGLSNRLRTLVSHIYIGKVMHNNAKVVMIWNVNEACPGHFLQIFKPLDRVIFGSNESRQVLGQHAIKVYPNSRDGFEQTMLTYDVNLVVSKRLWWHAEIQLYEQLQLTKEIEIIVENFVREHNVCNMTSMHIRKTDMDIELPEKKRSGYELYYSWVEKQKKDEPIFLITDDPKTQLHFVMKYGPDKIKFYKNMTDPSTDARLNSLTNGPRAHTAVDQLPLAVDHRFTTLEHAIVDVMIAAHGWDFRTTPFSSVSDLVKMFNLLHRWRWCGCTVRGC